MALTGCPKGFRETRNPSRIQATCSLEYKEMKVFQLLSYDLFLVHLKESVECTNIFQQSFDNQELAEILPKAQQRDEFCLPK